MSRYIDRAELFNRLSDVKTLAAAMAVIQDMHAAETKNVPDTNVGDLISRQAAIDALDGNFKVTGRENAETIRDYLNGVNKKLRELPSAERHGRWDDGKVAFHRVCSECGAVVRQDVSLVYLLECMEKVGALNYCPNCGAKMDDNAIQHTECVENALGALDEVTE